MMPDIQFRWFNPRRAPVWISLLCTAGALIIIGLTAYLGHANAETKTYAARPLVTVSSTQANAAPAAGCWVTGDLVGDSNPAIVAASLCGSPLRVGTELPHR